MLYNFSEPYKAFDNVTISLTLLSRMKLPTFIKWTSPFSASGLLGVVFHSNSNFNRTSYKQTAENLIRLCSLWRLILACIICLYAYKKNASLIWVNTFVAYATHISCIVFSSNWILIGYRAILTICIGMVFAICGTETVTIKAGFAMARINVNLMFHFSISTNIVNKKGSFRNKV